MIRRKNHKTDRRTQGKPQRRTRTPLVAHRAFAPLLGVWGAALGGLVTVVLPQATVLAGAANLGLGALGGLGRFALAGAAALVLGGALFVGARKLTRKARRTDDTPSIAAMAMRHVRMIDPVKELGSSSLDEPVECMPFALGGKAPEPEAEPQAGTIPAHQADDMPPPRELDLAQFAVMPGRNAVWVVDETIPAAPARPTPEPVPEPLSPSAPSPVAIPAASRPAGRPASRPASHSAIEHLRAVPPGELSLIQMVERFAAALHEHQAAAERRGDHDGPADRDAALAQALKALASFSPEGHGEPETAPLRDALARLQELRGAA